MKKDIIIEQVNNKNDAIICNQLLEKLIQSEKEFNKNIKSEYEVKEWFENFFGENTNAIFIAKKNEKITGYIYVNVLENNEKAKSLYENIGYNKFELKLKKEL